MRLPYCYEQLLSRLEDSTSGRRLALLSVHTKIEKFLLAEVLFSVAKLRDFECVLEDRPGRRDLTVRRRSDGSLVEWVEAKMCYSDCVARLLTNKGNADEYSALLASDAKKQRTAPRSTAELTTILFVVHRTEPHAKHKYYPGFSNRGELPAIRILREARRYCTKAIPEKTGRRVVEDFRVTLARHTVLHCFVYRDQRLAR